MSSKGASICTKAFAATEAVLYIACRVSPEPVPSKEICKYQGVSVRYLEHMLQKLVHDGILKGVRGPRGGYVLAKERRRIRLGDIYQSIEELEQKDAKTQPPSQLYVKIIEPMCETLKRDVTSKLSNKTIQDLCDEVTQKGIVIENKRKGDFSI